MRSSTTKWIVFGCIALNRFSRLSAFSRYATRRRAGRGAAIGGATRCRLSWCAADIALVIAAHVVERRQQIADVIVDGLRLRDYQETGLRGANFCNALSILGPRFFRD